MHNCSNPESRSKAMRTITFLCALMFSASTSAELYAYVNEDGDYVVSQKRPKEPVEYSVLTDDGDFIRLIPAPQENVTITHWRPWFLPREPDPLDGADGPALRLVATQVETELALAPRPARGRVSLAASGVETELELRLPYR